MPERAAYWPRAKTLIIADLHLGKADAMLGAGLVVSERVVRGVVRDDLGRLGRAVERTGAERVLIVGDLLHAAIGVTPILVEEVAAWKQARRVPWVVVRGNHDAKIGRVADDWELTVIPEILDEGGLRFVHIPPDQPPEGRYVISGHEHPAVTIGRGGSVIKLAAFQVGAWRMVLPAMSRFTAGGMAHREPGDRFYACTTASGGEVFEVPERGLLVR